MACIDVICTVNKPPKYYIAFRGTHKFLLYFDFQICGLATLWPWRQHYNIYMLSYDSGASQVTWKLFSPRFVDNSTICKHVIQYSSWNLLNSWFYKQIFICGYFLWSTVVDLVNFFIVKFEMRRTFCIPIMYPYLL